MNRTSEDNNEANAMLAGGAAVAAIGIVGAVVSGAVCPICIVAAPALLGIGAVRKFRAARRESHAEDLSSEASAQRR